LERLQKCLKLQLKGNKYKMDNTITLEHAVSKLLSEENKDKSLGEVSKELNDYIITIKELVEEGEITYETLQKELAKHINEEDNTFPGSLAQLLIGCVSENGSCPLKILKGHDIPFAYDNKLKKLVPLSKDNKPPNDYSYAVIYLTGQPDNLDTDIFLYLKKQGFDKVKIEYKNISSANYKTIYIENLKKYIYSQPEKIDDNLLYLLGLIIMILIFYFITKN